MRNPLVLRLLKANVDLMVIVTPGAASSLIFEIKLPAKYKNIETPFDKYCQHRDNMGLNSVLRNIDLGKKPIKSVLSQNQVRYWSGISQQSDNCALDRVLFEFFY